MSNLSLSTSGEVVARPDFAGVVQEAAAEVLTAVVDEADAEAVGGAEVAQLGQHLLLQGGAGHHAALELVELFLLHVNYFQIIMAEVLRNLKEQKNEHGVSLFAHLVSVFNQLTESKTVLASYDQFELLSQSIKQNHFLYNSLKTDADLKLFKEDANFQKKWVERCEAVLKRKPAARNAYVQNFVSESRIFESANVYFGEDETFRIQQSIAV